MVVTMKDINDVIKSVDPPGADYLQRCTNILKEGIKVIQDGTSVKLQNEWREEAERKAEALNSFLKEFSDDKDYAMSDKERKYLMKNYAMMKRHALKLNHNNEKVSFDKERILDSILFQIHTFLDSQNVPIKNQNEYIYSIYAEMNYNHHELADGCFDFEANEGEGRVVCFDYDQEIINKYKAKYPTAKIIEISEVSKLNNINETRLNLLEGRNRKKRKYKKAQPKIRKERKKN